MHRVVADDVDDRRARLVGVVEVRERVAQAGAEVQQRRGRDPGHPAVAVGRAGGDALEQREHRPHLRHPVQRRDQVHLRGARVGEARLHPAGRERPQHALGSRHRCPRPSAADPTRAAARRTAGRRVPATPAAWSATTTWPATVGENQSAASSSALSSAHRTLAAITAITAPRAGDGCAPRRPTNAAKATQERADAGEEGARARRAAVEQPAQGEIGDAVGGGDRRVEPQREAQQAGVRGGDGGGVCGHGHTVPPRGKRVDYLWGNDWWRNAAVTRPPGRTPRSRARRR